VTHTPSVEPIPLQEARIRAEHAHHIVTGLANANPALNEIWQQIDNSIADIPVLVTEVIRLSGQLTTTRLARANLAAAGKASITAWRNGESDPFSYLNDELNAQGFLSRSA
jgi:hypothetical protein